MRVSVPRRGTGGRAGRAVVALLAAWSLHGCLLPELVIDGDTGSDGLGGGAMSGGSSTGGDGSADGGSGGSGGTNQGDGGGSGDGGGDGSGGDGSGGDGSGGDGSGGDGSGGDGSGGDGSGGSSGGGGSGGSGGVPNGSLGCGQPLALSSGDQQIVVDGTSRHYVLDIPAAYDPNTGYRLILAFHWLDETGTSVAAGTGVGGPYYGLKALANDTAIFVAPTGLDNTWSTTDGQNLALVEDLTTYLEDELCIDETRVFAVGFSAGAMFSASLGCALPGSIRAVGVIAGSLQGGCADSDGNVAYFGVHGDQDQLFTVAFGQIAANAFATRNGCDDTTTPLDDSPCVAYDGCDAGYPVHYCEWAGDHAVPSFAAQAMWNFLEPF